MSLATFLSSSILHMRTFLQRCDSTSLGLIKASLQSKDTSWHGYFQSLVYIFCVKFSLWFREDRYLLLLTENYSALRILQQANLLDHDPLVLFGSSFPQDLNYTQVNSCTIMMCTLLKIGNSKGVLFRPKWFLLEWFWSENNSFWSYHNYYF